MGGTQYVTVYRCSVYYEANSTSGGLYAVSCPALEISSSLFYRLTSTRESYTKIVREGIKIVYDPRDKKIWFFERDMNKSLNEVKCTFGVAFASIMYIIAVIGTPVLCLRLSWIMASDVGNFTAPLLALSTTAIGWPLMYCVLCLFCLEICTDCSRQKFKIKRIGESKLPHLQADLKKNNNNKETIALTTSIQMSNQNK